MLHIEKELTMPKLAAAVKSKVVKKSVEVENGRAIVYPEPRLEMYVRGSELGPLTREKVEQLLLWEREPDYAKRMMAENPDLTEEQSGFKEDDWILKDLDLVKIALHGPFQHNG